MTERIEPYYELQIGSRDWEPVMTGKNQHVVPHGNDWAVRGVRNHKVTSIHPTQARAKRAARAIAINQRSEVVVHQPDGRIRDKNSYGHDPYAAEG